jgi:hypothetical protein
MMMMMMMMMMSGGCPTDLALNKSSSCTLCVGTCDPRLEHTTYVAVAPRSHYHRAIDTQGKDSYVLYCSSVDKSNLDVGG